MTNVLSRLLRGLWALGVLWGCSEGFGPAGEPGDGGAMVRVEQSYEREWYGERTPLQGVQLPIAGICNRLLDASNSAAPAARTASRPAVAVTLKGVALGRVYAMFSLEPGGVGRQIGQSVSFPGAAVSGSIVVEAGGKTIRKDFGARKPLPESVSRTLAATEAPFHEVLFYDGSLVPAMLAAITEISGVTTDNSPTLKRELESLRKAAGFVTAPPTTTPSSTTATDAREPAAKHPDYLPLVAGSTYRFRASYNGKSDTPTYRLMSRSIDGLTWYYFLEESQAATDSPESLLLIGNFPWPGAMTKLPGAITGFVLLPMSGDFQTQASPENRQTFLRLPIKQGDVTRVSVLRNRLVYELSVTGFETVTVPAGTFARAAKIRQECEADKSTSYFWLAPGVGLVKWVRGTGRTDELVSYSFPRGSSAEGAGAAAREPKTASKGEQPQDEQQQGVMLRYAPLTSHATVEVADGKGGWKAPDTPIVLGPTLASRHKVVAMASGKTRECLMVSQLPAHLLDEKGNRREQISIYGYQGCPFELRRDLQVAKGLEVPEGTQIVIESIIGDIVWLSESSSLPFVIRGGRLICHCAKMCNMKWVFTNAGIVLDTNTAQYVVERPNATVTFTKSGVVLDGVRKTSAATKSKAGVPGPPP